MTAQITEAGPRIGAQFFSPATVERGIFSQEAGVNRGFFRTGLTVDINALGLANLVPPSTDLSQVMRRTRQSMSNDGIRFDPTKFAGERASEGYGGRYRFDLLVPNIGLAGLTNEGDRLMAVRAYVGEKVIENMGLGDKLRPVEGWGGRKLFVPDESVFPPSQLGSEFTTEVMPAYMHLISGGNVLDLATGSGIFAVAAGLQGAREVTATDLNPSALTAVKVSWFINGLDPQFLHVVESDGFKDLDPRKKYDAILCNPPVQPGLGAHDQSDWRRWNETSAEDGRLVLDAVLGAGPDYLQSPGVILTTTTSRHGNEKTLKTLTELLARGTISSWDFPVSKEVGLDLRQYGQYVPYWQTRGMETNSPRIFERPDGTLSHHYNVLAVSK